MTSLKVAVEGPPLEIRPLFSMTLSRPGQSKNPQHPYGHLKGRRKNGTYHCRQCVKYVVGLVEVPHTQIVTGSSTQPLVHLDCD